MRLFPQGRYNYLFELFQYILRLKDWTRIYVIITTVLILHKTVERYNNQCGEFSSKSVNATLLQTDSHSTKVLLVSGHRTGGTFISELFNQNPDAFYLFEPLGAVQSIEPTLGCHSKSKEKLCLLKRLYSCDNPKYIHRLITRECSGCGGPVVVPIRHSLSNRCGRHNLCFRQHVKWSCEKELCQTSYWKQTKHFLTQTTNNQSNLETESYRRCDRCNSLNPHFINELCRMRKILAIKGINFSINGS